MNRKPIILVIFICLLNQVIPAQKNAFSTSWTATCKEDCIVAIVPAISRDSAFVDSLFSYSVAEKLQSEITVAYTSWVRELLLTNYNAKRITDRLLAASWSQVELMSMPSALKTITAEELGYLQELLMTDYLLIPYEFYVYDSGVNTTGFCQFRLYDLHSGDLIMVCRNDFMSEGTGLKATRKVSNSIMSDVSAMVQKALR